MLRFNQLSFHEKHGGRNIFFTNRLDSLIEELKAAGDHFKVQFDKIDDCSQLLLAVKEIKNSLDSLEDYWGEKLSAIGSLNRHLYYCIKYLEEDDKTSCGNDPSVISDYDIPAVENHIRKNLFSQQNVSPKLSQSVMPLINVGHYDAAIRKAFLVLTETLRAYDKSLDNIDGSDLVNRIFGKNSLIANGFTEDESKPMRDLLAGLYGYYRNKWFHGDGDCTIRELEAILSIINDLLFKIEDARP